MGQSKDKETEKKEESKEDKEAKSKVKKAISLLEERLSKSLNFQVPDSNEELSLEIESINDKLQSVISNNKLHLQSKFEKSFGVEVQKAGDYGRKAYYSFVNQELVKSLRGLDV